MSDPTSDAAARATIAARCRAFVRHDDPTPPALKRAAVAITLVETNDNQIAFLLTLRAASLRAHSNQWALPGGRCDGDETAIDAALRELNEEVGLLLTPADVLGVLDEYPTRSGYLITPVVAWAGNSARLMPNADEVAEVHHIPLALITDPHAFDFITIPQSDRPVIRYRYEGQYIHAPTAALIYQFRELLAGRITRVAKLEQPVFAWR